MTTFIVLPFDRHVDAANLQTFGSVQVLIPGTRPSIWEGASLIAALQAGLAAGNFDPATDHIALTGRTVYLAILMVALWEYVDAHFPEDTGIMFLVYDAGPQIYKEMRLPRAHAKV